MPNKKFKLLIILILLFSNACSSIKHRPITSDLETLLNNKRYDQLDSVLKNYQNIYEANMIEEEENIYIAFYAFNTKNTSLEVFFNEWVDKHPKSYAAYLARGIYYKNMGWKKRGEKYISETTKKQISGMNFYFQKSLMDFEKTMEINPNLLLSYCYMIDILKNYKKFEIIRTLADRGLEKNPNSLLIRWFYLNSILPRWGGSVEKMQDFINEAKPYYKNNPKLKILDGRVFAEKGDQALFAKRYEKALVLYNQALEYGDHYYYNRQKGETLLVLNQYGEAIKEFDKSLISRPRSLSTLYSKAYSHYKLSDFDKSLQVLETILQLEPEHKRSNSLKNNIAN